MNRTEKKVRKGSTLVLNLVPNRLSETRFRLVRVYQWQNS